MKSLEIDNEFYKERYESSSKKNIMLHITEILLGSGSRIITSKISNINPSVGIVISSSTASLTSIVI